MNVESIKNIKLSLLEVPDDTNMDPKKLDCIIRASISINLEDLDFTKSEDAIKTIVKDMYDNLRSSVKLPVINYLGIWIKYDDEVFDNSIKIQTLDDIQKYSVEEVNSVFEFLKMTLPD